MAYTRVRVWVYHFCSACKNTNMTPTFDCQDFFLGTGFFRVTLKSVLHLAPRPALRPSLSASFHFPSWTVLFVASLPVFISLCTVPPDPSFFRTAFLRSYLGLVYRALFSPLFPTWHCDGL